MRILLLLSSLLVLLSSCVNNIPENALLKTGPIQNFKLFDASSNPGVACYRIPAFATAPNGDLVAVAAERVPNCNDMDSNKNINLVMRRSTDNGQTWTSIKTLVDYPDGQSIDDPSMIVDKVTGDIFMFFNYMNLNTESGIYYQRVMKSSDNGKTWSSPVDITSQIRKPEWHSDYVFMTSGDGIQTSSGTLLHTIINLSVGGFVFASNDHGKSWSLIDKAITPADESKLVQLSNGNWMINSRVNGAGMRYEHVSSDKGKTWSTKADSDLPDPGCNGDILRYTLKSNGSDKNRILFSNANSSSSRKNMTVRLSYDEGKTWPVQKTIYAGSSAYSDMTVMANGDIGLVYEKDDYSYIVFDRFTLSWLTNGNDSYQN